MSGRSPGRAKGTSHSVVPEETETVLVVGGHANYKRRPSSKVALGGRSWERGETVEPGDREKIVSIWQSKVVLLDGDGAVIGGAAEDEDRLGKPQQQVLDEFRAESE
jgi:hypothetical protein